MTHFSRVLSLYRALELLKVRHFMNSGRLVRGCQVISFEAYVGAGANLRPIELKKKVLGARQSGQAGQLVLSI